MKTLIFAALLLLAQASSLCAQSKNISIPSIPTDMDKFTQLRDQTAISPEGGAAIFVVAMLMYSQDADLGMQAFTVALDQSRIVEGNIYKGFAPVSGAKYDIENYYGKHKDHLGNSYIVGTKTADNYKLGKLAYKMEFSRNKYTEQSNGAMRIFIKCNGASSPRPITLKQNDKGIWKVSEFSSLFVGVAKPVGKDRL